MLDARCFASFVREDAALTFSPVSDFVFLITNDEVVACWGLRRCSAFIPDNFPGLIREFFDVADDLEACFLVVDDAGLCCNWSNTVVFLLKFLDEFT